MEKMQTGRRIITTLPVHGHQNRLIYALTMLLIAKIIIFRLLGIRQGIHTITGSYDAKKQITLPIALKCYVLGTACTNSIHQMEAALVTNKTAAGFKTSWLI